MAAQCKDTGDEGGAVQNPLERTTVPSRSREKWRSKAGLRKLVSGMSVASGHDNLALSSTHGSSNDVVQLQTKIVNLVQSAAQAVQRRKKIRQRRSCGFTELKNHSARLISNDDDLGDAHQLQIKERGSR